MAKPLETRLAASTHKVLDNLHPFDDMLYPLTYMPGFAQGAMIYLASRDAISGIIHPNADRLRKGLKVKQVKEAAEYTEAMEEIKGERSQSTGAPKETVREKNRRENNIVLSTTQKLEYLAEIIERILAQPGKEPGFSANPINTAFELGAISVTPPDIEIHYFDRDEVSPNTAIAALLGYLSSKESMKVSTATISSQILGRDYRDSWDKAGADVRGTTIRLTPWITLVLKPRLLAGEKRVDGFTLAVRIKPAENINIPKEAPTTPVAKPEFSSEFVGKTAGALNSLQGLISHLDKNSGDLFDQMNWVRMNSPEPFSFSTAEAQEVVKAITAQYVSRAGMPFPATSSQHAAEGDMRYLTANYSDKTNRILVVLEPMYSEEKKETTWKIGFKPTPEYVTLKKQSSKQTQPQ